MAGINYDELIPNNVNLSSDKRLKKALEKWQPKFLDWWNVVGPQVFADNDIYLRTATSVERDGWAHFDHVKMKDYRWGIFLSEAEENRVIPGGDDAGKPVWQEVPGEYRNSLKRLIVTQADTEPASVEQQRWLAQTAPSLYDARNLFQVNVEEGRHLWAMVYLLQAYFGRDGREEADLLLERCSGDEDKPRILDAFNQPCSDWLTFFCFTTFADRDGKYQLAALAESAFDPLSRTCRFMLIEEAHHLFVGQKGIERILRRAVQLAKKDPNGDTRAQGGIDIETIQKYVNYWFPYCLDLFGSEISTNAADSFASGVKGRYKEATKYTEHTALDQFKNIDMVENGKLITKEIPLRNAMNEILREEYAADCHRVLKSWNRALKEEGSDQQISLPHHRFFRRQGLYSDHNFDHEGNMISKEEFESKQAGWLPSLDDRAYVLSLMEPVHEAGKCANWIAAPNRGVNGQKFEFEYVRS